MERKPLISVVVPIYNVEAYLSRCIKSIVNQTYKNLEIILVDDGSPDKCGQICDEWAEKDQRVVVIHKKNGGLSDARNSGVAKSSGEYVTFIDSDDYVSRDYVEYLWNLLEKEQADVSCGNLTLVYDQDENFERQPKKQSSCYSNIQACRELLSCKSIQLPVAWSKLYKKTLLEQNPFPVGRYHEDEAVVYKIFYESKRISVGNRKIYGYYQNNMGSITSSRSVKKVNDAIQALEERCEFFKQRNEQELYRLALRPYLVLMVNEAAEGNQDCQRKLENYSLSDILLHKGSMKLKSQFLFYKMTGNSLNRLLRWKVVHDKLERLQAKNIRRKRNA